MNKKKVIFSPVTRLSGLLSVELTLEQGKISEANASSTMFRGFEWIMRGHHATDAVYLTMRVCGICSTAHAATASYLLDELYDNEIQENAQYMRNIMYAADFLQNHIRHFYIFSLPDFVIMPECFPFHGQNLRDARLNAADNKRLVEHYFEAATAAQESHQLLALFGGKAPHQHSFLHGGVTTASTADKINQAFALLEKIKIFVNTRMVPDTKLIARAYKDYFKIGQTPKRLLSFGLFRFGPKNEEVLWPGGVLVGNKVYDVNKELIEEDVSHAWFEASLNNKDLKPDPYKPGAYTFTKAVRYRGLPFEVGPLARMLLTKQYQGETGTMDRIVARTIETARIAELAGEWLRRLKPSPPPLNQKQNPVKQEAVSLTDAMRGALLHSVRVTGESINNYNIITPSVWNFSPKDALGRRGPVEDALVGTEVPSTKEAFTVLGRIIRSFDPCISCATHFLNLEGENLQYII